MLRSAASKVAWVGRTASMVFGLALVMALVIGAASTAMGATGGSFILGKANAANKASKLTASIAGPALTLVNQSTMAAATALNISVAPGQAPIKVNAEAGTAANLSADELDGKDSNDFAPEAVEAWREVGAANQPAFQNGWTNYGGRHSTAAFYKNPWGTVHLKGLVKNGTVSRDYSGGVFHLPCGYGPGHDEVHSVLSNDAAGRVTILLGYCDTGQYSATVTVAPPSNNAWVSLDGITFWAAGS